MANAMPFRALRNLSDGERAQALGRIEAGIHPQDVASQSTFIVAPLFDSVIVIEQWGLFLTDPDLEDQKLQPSLKKIHCSNCSKATLCGWPKSGDQVHVASQCRLSVIEFQLLGSFQENLLKILRFPNVTGL